MILKYNLYPFKIREKKNPDREDSIRAKRFQVDADFSVRNLCIASIRVLNKNGNQKCITGLFRYVINQNSHVAGKYKRFHFYNIYIKSYCSILLSIKNRTRLPFSGRVVKFHIFQIPSVLLSLVTCNDTT